VITTPGVWHDGSSANRLRYQAQEHVPHASRRSEHNFMIIPLCAQWFLKPGLWEQLFIEFFRLRSDHHGFHTLHSQWVVSCYDPWHQYLIILSSRWMGSRARQWKQVLLVKRCAENDRTVRSVPEGRSHVLWNQVQNKRSRTLWNHARNMLLLLLM